jgi:hypothetical protein
VSLWKVAIVPTDTRRSLREALAEYVGASVGAAVGVTAYAASVGVSVGISVGVVVGARVSGPVDVAVGVAEVVFPDAGTDCGARVMSSLVVDDELSDPPDVTTNSTSTVIPTDSLALVHAVPDV